MTTKLPDAPPPPNELPPDPMIDGTNTIALNYQARVNEANLTPNGASSGWDARLLARAALSFESEMAMLALGHDIDQHGGTPTSATSVSLPDDPDIQIVTNGLLGVASYIIANVPKVQSEPQTANSVRAYVAARAAVTRLMETLSAVL
jgi:hypothetical protein